MSGERLRGERCACEVGGRAVEEGFGRGVHEDDASVVGDDEDAVVVGLEVVMEVVLAGVQPAQEGGLRVMLFGVAQLRPRAGTAHGEWFLGWQEHVVEPRGSGAGFGRGWGLLLSGGRGGLNGEVGRVGACGGEEGLDAGHHVGVLGRDVVFLGDVGGEVVEFDGLVGGELNGFPVAVADGLLESALVEFPVERWWGTLVCWPRMTGAMETPSMGDSTLAPLTRSARVGRKSQKAQTWSLVLPWGTTPGQRTIIGTRMPPS